jgi:murein L,D-transpeptidase YcbB/YkuD
MKAELLPHIRKDAAYLEQHAMEIVAGQGDDASPLQPTPDVVEKLAAGKLRLRQKPGGDNPLGQVKFMLPNDYNIYLHSTPARELFRQSRRAFSHGCIRVSDPTALAEYVLQNAAGHWTRERIEAAMSGADNQRVDLEQWIRVLIVYGTAVATEAGRVYFFNDIYGNDARLEKLLAQ